MSAKTRAAAILSAYVLNSATGVIWFLKFSDDRNADGGAFVRCHGGAGGASAGGEEEIGGGGLIYVSWSFDTSAHHHYFFCSEEGFRVCCRSYGYVCHRPDDHD